MAAAHRSFLEPGRLLGRAGAPVVIAPVPLELTTSYGQGTARGPQAILNASHQVETWDEQLKVDLESLPFATAPACAFLDAESIEEALETVHTYAKAFFAADQIPIFLGGEHSLTVATVRAAAEIHPDLGVVQFDAHADRRESYGGTPWSHACVMRRLDELGLPSLAVGIRSLSRDEASYIEEANLPIVWGRELEELTVERFRALLADLPDAVYVTFDVDYFDPSVLPATGTPEPGGGTWHPTVEWLGALLEDKRVVGMDVVELSPIEGLPASDFTAARLVAKALALSNPQSGVVGVKGLAATRPEGSIA